MDAMELFRKRVEESAKAAAGAALQLSALDDMAQNDDYIQSEGLNISEKKKGAPSMSSASSYSSGNSEMRGASVVEDLSGKFVDALDMVARKNRPRPAVPAVNENNPRIYSPHYSDSQAVEQPCNLKSKSREKTMMQMQQPKPRSVPQQPKLVSSVAALYEQNDQNKNTPKQNSHKKATMHKKRNHHNSRAKERVGIPPASKFNQSPAPASLATIPSSPEQHKNVLLVNDKHAHILHELGTFSDDDSSDDERFSSDSDDLEIGDMGGNAALHNQLEQELEDTITRQHSQTGPTNNESEERDVNRFMTMTAGLEIEREPLINSTLQPVPEVTPTNFTNRVQNPGGNNDVWGTAESLKGNPGEETTNALRAGLSWVKNVASPQLTAISQQIISKVNTEADNIRRGAQQSVGGEEQWQQQRPNKRAPMIGPRFAPTATIAAEEENITMTSSASFLADADMAELDRIRMRNSPSKLTILVQSCASNPRLVFIAVTLVLALFAYFFSRHRSVDDVL